MERPTIFGIVVAAGGSVRFGAGTPKQFQDLEGRSVLERSIELLTGHPAIDGVWVVLSPDRIGTDVGNSVRKMPGVAGVTAGGSTRAESALNGVRAAAAADFVLVHDAARPGASGDLVERVVEATLESGAAIPAVRLKDTCKEVSPEGTVVRTPDRDRLRAAQTPQGARRDWLEEALVGALRDRLTVTDEASALEAAGRTVQVVDGENGNIKITTREDLESLRSRYGGKGEAMRVGTGFDVHRFGGNGPLVLGGVPFPGETGLEGHSDADVVLHAAMDAILGAAALGDIGRHFPPGDPAWAGADSRVLSRSVRRMILDAGFHVENLDTTVLAESPKIGPKVEAMRGSIADCFGLPAARVGVKATTLETLGALGRGEGIGCQAVALLRAVSDGEHRR